MITLSDIVALLEKIPGWKRMVEAPARIDALEKRLAEFEAKGRHVARPGGKPCPACSQPSFFQISVRDDPVMGVVGLKRRTYRCDSCQHEEEIQEK